MLNKFPDKIQYISKDVEVDKFGYRKNEAVEKTVRYVGGQDVYISNGDNSGTEYRLIFHCPFEVKVEDKFIYKGHEMSVKKSEEVRDIFYKTIHWRVEVV